jgi:hypothetical protein
VFCIPAGLLFPANSIPVPFYFPVVSNPMVGTEPKGAAATNVGIFIYIWDKSAVSGTILYNTTIVTLPCRDAPCQQTKFLHD